MVVGGKQIEADSHLFPRLEELSMVLVYHLLWTYPFLVSSDGYGRAMLIAAPKPINTSLPLHAVVPCENVGRQIATSKVTQMQGTISIGPSRSYEDALGHTVNPYFMLRNEEATSLAWLEDNLTMEVARALIGSRPWWISQGATWYHLLLDPPPASW